MVQDFSQYALEDIGADYTIELGTLIAMGYDTDEKLHLSPDYYPIFNEQHRAELNEKIIRHYLMREISVETPQAFAFLLGRTMNENMPYYNQLYETELMKFDPFITTEIWQTGNTANTSNSDSNSTAKQTANSDGNSTSNTTTDNTAMTFNSEFPQTRIDDFRRYATSASQTDSRGTSDTATRQHSTNDTATDSTGHQTDTAHGSSEAHTSGFSGSRSQLLNEFRNTLLNIDMMVVQSLEKLFMQTWGSSDSMTNRPIPPWYGAQFSALGYYLGR